MDFAVVSEIENTFSLMRKGNEKTRRVETAKIRKYKSVRFGTSAIFFPTVASTSGAWGQEANKAFQLIAAHIAEGSLASESYETRS